MSDFLCRKILVQRNTLWDIALAVVSSPFETFSRHKPRYKDRPNAPLTTALEPHTNPGVSMYSAKRPRTFLITTVIGTLIFVVISFAGRVSSASSDKSHVLQGKRPKASESTAIVPVQEASSSSLPLVV